MLVLSRRRGEQILIGDNIQIVILKVQGEKVQLAIRAPNKIGIRRAELPAKADELSGSTNLLPAEDPASLLPFKPPQILRERRVFRRSPLGDIIEAKVVRDNSEGRDSNSVEKRA